MKRRTLFKSAAVAVLAALGQVLPRIGRAQARVRTPAQPGTGKQSGTGEQPGVEAGGLNPDHRAWVDAIGEVVLPTSLGAGGRARAVAAFATWLEEYKAGVPMSYGYGNDLKYDVVPPSPLLRYPAQFARLQTLSKAKGAGFQGLSPADRRAVLEEALREAEVSGLPDRPDGRHVASDLLSHFYSSGEGNDFLFNAAIRESDCRGLGSSADRPASRA